MDFVDLFAGLGGFHLALKTLGHRCAFACEIDSELQGLYERNFGLGAEGDIRKVNIAQIPAHDILCAGFPCQPFSKAGPQGGFSDPESGDLFYYILRILESHKPRFLLLENVPNFQRHNNGETWKKAGQLLEDEGYAIQVKKLSPHRFGIPQIRERIYIVGGREGLSHFSWPSEITDEGETSVHDVLDSNPPNARHLPEQVISCIHAWQTFLDILPREEKLPSFPIWSMEFGATYPFEETTPWRLGASRLAGYRGSHGIPLDGTEESFQNMLPSYAKAPQDHFPKWKIQFIRQNREFYGRHRAILDQWKKTILDFPQSLQKFEWNCQGSDRNLRKLVLQVRASGLRAKRPTTSPSLVAMTATQVPIISWEDRYMTPRECARLQSMEELELPSTQTKAYQALGNAVNVNMVRLIASSLLGESKKSESA